MKRFTLYLCALALAACATVDTPQQSVYQIESNYIAAVKVATTYATLPRCGTAGVILCSKQDVIDKLKQADTVAYNALTAARNTATAPGAGANAQTALLAAQQATLALSAIAATLQTQP